MGFVDCDSHLIEGEETWSYLDPSEQMYQPMLTQLPKAASFAGQTLTTSQPDEFWLAGDTWTSHSPPDSNRRGNANVYAPESTHLLDPAVRISDLDALGIEMQLLISSFFIGIEIDHPLAEAAIARSYNRWAADVVGEHTDRFRWSLRPPLRLLERAFEELEFGAANGAAGIHVRGIEHGYYLSDPYFYPLYERAQDLNLAILVHVGAALRRVDNQPIGKVLASPPAFFGHVSTLMAGFHAVISSDLHERFPRLRWGFLEGGATWATAVLQQHARLVASASTDFLDLRPVTPDELEAKNVFIACEADEDLPYLTKVLGENVLCIGSDYAHNDVGSELAAHTTVLNRTDISASVAHKIVDTNGRKLLGLSPGTGNGISPAMDIPETLPHVRGASTHDGKPILTSVR